MTNTLREDIQQPALTIESGQENAQPSLATPNATTNTSQERKPWERMPDEPSDWYNRFLLFLGLGYNRSVVGAYRKEQQGLPEDDAKKDQDWDDREGAPKSWYNAAHQYNWSARATAYDDAQARALLSNEEEIQRIARAKRIDAALAGLEKVTNALKAKAQESVEKESVNALSQASKVYSQILREDLDGASTTTRHLIEVVLRELPPEIAQLLADYVKR